MWFSDMLYNLHVWYLQSEVLYMLSSPHSKSQLSDSVLHRLCYIFFSFYMKPKGHHTKTGRIPSSINISRPLMSTQITTIIRALQRVSYEENTMLIQCWWFCVQSQIHLFFSSFPRIDMLAQLHSTKTTKFNADDGPGTMVRKTSLLSKPYCCWVCFSACCGICMFASYKQSPQPAETRHGKRWTCVLAVLDWYSCYGISTWLPPSYNLWRNWGSEVRMKELNGSF